MNNVTILTLQAPNVTDFASARNRMLTISTTDWALFLDQDEVLTPALEKEIEVAINDGGDTYSAYSIPRQDLFLGRVLQHGENAHNRFVRLVKKGTGQWERPVHEVWVSTGKVASLKSPLLHNLPNVTAFLDKINTYSTIEANYRKSQGAKSSLFKIVIYPFAKFKLNYFLRLGIMDGVPGAIMAIMMSFHSYLTWTKLYLLWRQK